MSTTKGPLPEPTASGISDVQMHPAVEGRPGRITPVNRLRPQEKMSVLEGVPDSDDMETQDGTPITDMGSLFRKMTTTSRLVENVARTVAEQTKHVQKIPEIVEKSEKAWRAATETREEVIIVRTRQEDQSKRLERIENIGHPCQMTARIESVEDQTKELAKEQVQDVIVRTQVAGISAALSDFKSDRQALLNDRKSFRNLIIGISMSVIMAAVGSGGSAIWFIRGLQSDLQLEVQARETRDKNLDKHLSKIATTEELDSRLPSENELKQFTQAVNGNTYFKRTAPDPEVLRSMFNGLPRAQQVQLCREEQGKLPEYLLESCPE